MANASPMHIALLVLALSAARPAGAQAVVDSPGVSPRAATRMSAAVTVVPIVVGGLLLTTGDPTAPILLTTAGLLIGPATGYFAGGRPWRGTLGVVIRGAALGAVVAGFIDAFNSSSSPGVQAMWGGTAVMVVSAAWDVARVGANVRAGQEEAALPARELRITPMIDAAGRVGLALAF